MESLIRKSKILVVDDEVEILNLIKKALKKEGFENIYIADNGTNGLEIFKNENPDLAILDIMLPDIEGYDVCKKIRQTSDIPVLFLSAKGEELDKLVGLSIGADDYITKPFSIKELALRVKIQLRRSKKQFNIEEKINNNIIKVGPFEVNEQTLEVKKNGELLELKPKELKMFMYMVKHKNQIISKEKFCDEVWGDDFIGYDNTIMVHIRRLREKIEDNPSKPEYIINVKGLGYKFLVKE
ncbi:MULTISPECIES: response regulator transcription factor [Romboutsia]|uniref:response regulator transcription factor n=1 Tax=Romboutsia TaxID=1501226 RepID=UPI000AF0F0EA|nr:MULTISPECIES: response regulator transcription factor [Romboutsia]MCH1959063.1 response regulator transcription factor [Romboutsia hominis]MCH1968185.1 response regulator transcription factor [Romboutsia hominis]MDB8794159.1 response regulator transcription factor [Romboutsia sp. 1001216sp1]MDB8797188.1 response regulator transcription factor [Romboutsia sp. 1001216sp1]MDB8799986.1 response regulator transcription factor [Romboutsia sp. 1001216sp1]